MEIKKKLSIKDLSEDDRPREKLLKKGINSLSDAELIAILIASGNRNETAIELSKRLLNACNNNLNTLANKSIKELTKNFTGIGIVKAITILSALELGRRCNISNTEQLQTIQSSHNVYQLMQPLLGKIKEEQAWIILLNHANKIIHKCNIALGTQNKVSLDIPSILKEALIHEATGIILCHNHPSGNNQPSQEDDLLTYELSKAANAIHLQLLDHVIITENTYYSYKDANRL